MRVVARLLIAGALIGELGIPLAGQAPPDPFVALPPVPPPTALEAFSPSDTLITMGYTELGGVAAGGALVRVDVRELRTPAGDGVRGVAVDVIESETRRDRSFIDVDEIAPLLRGIDAMLEVRANPTSFDRYELRYVTRGELWLRTVVTSRGSIVYAMQAGRTARAQAQLEVADLVKLRGLFAAAAAKLGTP
jgi:hypothetical protein